MKGSVPMLFDCNATHSQPVFFSICACKWDQLPYSGKLSREKTFTDCSLLPPKDTMPRNFAEKTFMNGLKTSIFAKVFSLESFSLYVTIQSITICLLTHSINGYKWQHYTIPYYTHSQVTIVVHVRLYCYSVKSSNLCIQNTAMCTHTYLCRWCSQAGWKFAPENEDSIPLVF